MLTVLVNNVTSYLFISDFYVVFKILSILYLSSINAIINGKMMIMGNGESNGGMFGDG
jgi:hypothetical protein